MLQVGPSYSKLHASCSLAFVSPLSFQSSWSANAKRRKRQQAEAQQRAEAERQARAAHAARAEAAETAAADAWRRRAKPSSESGGRRSNAASTSARSGLRYSGRRTIDGFDPVGDI